MSVTRVGDWNKAAKFLAEGPRKAEAGLDRALRREAEVFRKEVIQGITKGAPGGKKFQKLSKFTLAMRKSRGFRGRKPLIEGGDLRRSIKVVKGPGVSYFVGVLRQARGKNGQPLVNVAAVQEFGATITIRLTTKMRRFLAMTFRQAGLPKPTSSAKSTLVVKIPARPFLQPVADKLRSGSAARVGATMEKFLKP